MPDGSPLPVELYQLTPEEIALAPEMEGLLSVYPGTGEKMPHASQVSSALADSDAQDS
jgi:hypothetical protein